MAAIILAYVIRYFAFAKQGFHIDEIYSYGLSNSYYNPFPTEANKWLAGNYYQDYLMPNATTRFKYGSVISNQVNDVHPPLYYLLFHTIASVWQGGFSPLVGLSLNILAHLATVIVVGLIIHLLTKNAFLSIITGLFWGLSIGGLSSMIFIRMYHLMGFLVVLLLYFLLLYVRTEHRWQYFLVIPIFLVTFAGALTHYYFYIFAFFAIAVTCLGLLFLKHFAKAIAVGLSALAGIVSAWAFFPAIFTHITQSNRGVEALQNANDSHLTANLLRYLGFIQEDLLADIPLKIFLVGAFVLALLLIIGSKRFLTKHSFVEMWMLVIPAGAFIVVVQDLSFYHTARYIFPIYPVIAIIISLCLYYGLGTLLKNGLATALIVVTLTITVGTGFTTETVDFQYQDQGQLNQSLIAVPKENAMVFSQKRWQIAEYASQLSQFKQVYPMVLTSTEVDALPVLQEDQIGQALTVFTNNPDLNQDDLIRSIMEKYNFTSVETIHQVDELMVYSFE